MYFTTEPPRTRPGDLSTGRLSTDGTVVHRFTDGTGRTRWLPVTLVIMRLTRRVLLRTLVSVLLLVPGTLVPGTAASGSETAEPLRFGWPMAATPALGGLGHPLVLRPFQPPTSAYGPGHRGVDLAGRLGQPVLAAGDGVVVYAGWLANREVVSIEHPGGLRTTYEPVSPTVRSGQRVTRGQQVGVLEPAPSEREVGLHWGAHRGREYLDPLRLVTQTVRLLPWGAPPESATQSYAFCSVSLLRSRSTARVCSWHTRDSVTPSTLPISARVRFSK